MKHKQNTWGSTGISGLLLLMILGITLYQFGVLMPCTAIFIWALFAHMGLHVVSAIAASENRKDFVRDLLNSVKKHNAESEE